MRSIDMKNRVYKDVILETTKILLETNKMHDFFNELDGHEVAMAQRLFGVQFCNLIQKEGGFTKNQTLNCVENLFEKDRFLDERERVQHEWRGKYASGIYEELEIKEKFEKSFSPKVISHIILKTLKSWGYVESNKDSNGVMTYLINGYKQDYLCSLQ